MINIGKTVMPIYLIIVLMLIAGIFGAGKVLSNSNSIAPIIGFLLSADSSVVGLIEADRDLGQENYYVLYSGKRYPVMENKVVLDVVEDQVIATLLTGDSEVAGFGLIRDGQLEISPKTTAFYRLVQLSLLIDVLDIETKYALFDGLDGFNSYPALAAAIDSLSWQPIDTDGQQIAQLLVALLNEMVTPVAQPRRATFSAPSLKNKKENTFDTFYANGIALRDITITPIGDDTARVDFTVKSKNPIYQALRSGRYDPLTNSYVSLDVQEFIDPKSSSNLIDAFTDPIGIIQGFSDSFGDFLSIRKYGFVDQISNTVGVADSSKTTSMVLSCTNDTIIVEGTSIDARVFNAISLAFGATSTIVDLKGWFNKVTSAQLEAFAGNFGQTIKANILDDEEEFIRKVLAESATRIIRTQSSKDTFFNLIKFIEEGDLENLKGALLNQEFYFDLAEVLLLSTIDVITEGAFADSEFLANIEKQAFGAFKNFFFAVLLDKAFSAETGINEDIDYSDDGTDWESLGNTVFENVISFIYKVTGLAFLEKAISATIGGSDAFTLAFGAAAPPQDYTLRIANLLPSCPAQPSIDFAAPLFVETNELTDFQFFK